MKRTTGAATISLISTVFVVAVSAILFRRSFQDSPPPDFSDLYLLCVLGLAYRYAWQFAAILAAVSLAVLAYVLTPLDWRDGFQLGSYALCEVMIIWIMASLRIPVRTTA
jgi:hypothetical protein